MQLSPSTGRRNSASRSGGRLRYVLYAMIVAGTGTLAHLGTSLAILAMSPDRRGPEPGFLAPVGGGTLLICGGGRTPDSVRDRFAELAGGRNARIVVIPTAAGLAADEPGTVRTLDTWRARGAASVRLLHTRDRARADDEEFLRPLAEATGVWINGGYQTWLSTAYAGTGVERALKDLLERGGVVGGTSAGAAIMSRLMISKGRDEAETERGLDLIPGVVIDQHFLKRNRMKRLLGVLENHPDLIGLGVDEQTAVEVSLRHQRLRVLGNSYAVACVPGPDPGDRSPRLDVMKPGDEADLKALKTRTINAVIPGIEVEGL